MRSRFSGCSTFRSLENTNVRLRFLSHIYLCHIARTVMWSFSLLSPLFKRKSLIMKNISTGFGLCAIAAAVALYPVLDRFAPIAKEAHAGVPVSAITSAALAQTAPTIVWYGVGAHSPSGGYAIPVLFRAWSDGKDGPAHQSWTPMTILSDPLGRLERFGADVAE